MKRLKQVYNSEQVCHLWAQCIPERTARNDGKTIFFEGRSIYSYGHHYLLGRIYDNYAVKGNEDGIFQRFALINSDRYSVTTAKHQNYAARAVRNHPKFQDYIFHTPHPESPMAALQAMHDELRAHITELSTKKTLKVTSEYDKQQFYGKLFAMIQTHNRLAVVVGAIAFDILQDDILSIEAHLTKRLARYNELNTPEMIARKKEIAQAKADAEYQKELSRQAEAIEKFRQGEYVSSYLNLRTELLRINGDEVQTSRGARVPLVAARTLLRHIQDGKSVIGRHVGVFTINEITETQDDKIIHIGCHRILLSEAVSVLGKV